jgi:hypothetical protein
MGNQLKTEIGFQSVNAKQLMVPIGKYLSNFMWIHCRASKAYSLRYAYLVGLQSLNSALILAYFSFTSKYTE